MSNVFLVCELIVPPTEYVKLSFAPNEEPEIPTCSILVAVLVPFVVVCVSMQPVEEEVPTCSIIVAVIVPSVAVCVSMQAPAIVISLLVVIEPLVETKTFVSV